MKLPITEKEIKDFLLTLQNKKISLVGNAKSLFDKQYGEKIDSSDIVIRMNRGYPVEFESQGRRTDVLFINNRFIADKVITDYLLSQVPSYYFLLGGHNKGEVISELFRGSYYNSYKMWKGYPELRKPPSQGFQIINLLSNEVECELNLFGFDFMESETHMPRKELFIHRDKLPHDFEMEKKVVTKIFDSKNNFGWKIWT